MIFNNSSSTIKTLKSLHLLLIILSVDILYNLSKGLIKFPAVWKYHYLFVNSYFSKELLNSSFIYANCIWDVLVLIFYLVLLSGVLSMLLLRFCVLVLVLIWKFGDCI